MSTFLRKSFKMGPVRFNLSKSGLGISTGVRGLRVGLSGNGKPYIAGGRGGLYFRNYSKSYSSTPQLNSAEIENIKSSDTYQQITEMTLKNIEIKLAFKQGPILFLFIFISIFLILLHPAFSLLFLFLCFYVIFKAAKLLIYEIKAKGFVKKFENLSNKEKICEVIEQLKKISQIKNKEIRKFMFSKALIVIFPHIAEDRILSKEEEELLKIIKDNLGETKTDLGVYFLETFLFNFTQDKELDENEETFLEKIINIFELPEENITEYKKIIEYYKKLRQLKIENLQPIVPSVKNIKEAEECYYETECKILKNTIVKRFTSNGVRHKITSFITDKEGKVFITKSTLQIIADGHKVFKLSQILAVNYAPEENGILELTISGRKEPIYISTPEIEKTMIIISKLKEN